MTSLAQARLYGIVDTAYLGGNSPRFCAEQMIAGGVDILQIRAKGLAAREVARMTREVLPVCRAAGVPLVVNDHPEIARDEDADGCHVGQDDLGVAEVRRLLGPGKIVGKSTHSLEQALTAVAEMPDYIGVGPVYATQTKPDYIPVGLELVSLVRQAADQGRLPLPFFCIGGIKLGNLPQVRAAGARAVVVVSGILTAPDIRQMCQDLRQGLPG